MYIKNEGLSYNALTMEQFSTLWHDTRKRKNSTIVAGLDRSFDVDFTTGKAVDAQEWARSFIDAVAPYVSAIKFNQAFYQGIGQRSQLRLLVAHTHAHGLLAISDTKFADIGSTNEAWIHSNKQLGFDAVTCAPYAGNITESIDTAHKAGIAIINMGMMSNPEFQNEMHFLHPQTQEQLWHYRVRTSLESHVDGIVIGGTYTHDNPDFQEFVKLTKESDCLFLIPGIGFQGGSIENFLASGIDPERCMISASRSIMFPDGIDSTPHAQGNAAKALQVTFNDVVYGTNK